MFKGIVPANSQVQVKFSANYTNTDVAHVFVAIGRNSGIPSEEYATASPGGFANIAISADLQSSPKGILRILVDMAQESDAGMLEVTANGKPLPDSAKAIVGDTTWTYNVR